MTASAPRIAVYPGSFDPLTNGHVDIIERGRYIFDKIIVSVLINRDKSPLFSIDERVAMIREVFRDQADVEVDTFHGLLVDYARRKQLSLADAERWLAPLIGYSRPADAA